ncbi:hypothetical protein DPM19_25775 [Actinomadura craniellae]|uniref:Uncharacterized protein n=1 Tax=Actinomadura craniellae TaxID=2231787 RepID=A0A365GZ81_9ACTN|nr:hypothetical protein [Actinomadura craniellae]RAY12140.1 hypothetical protein DPM19_25775 [Actinomadura craniellae]
MSNGARHGLGIVVGLLITPVLFAGLAYGGERATRGVRMFDSGAKWTALAVFLLVALLLGLLAGSRVSPLAALIPGLSLLSVGYLWFDGHLGRVLRDGPLGDYTLSLWNLGLQGVLLLLGLALVASALPPSRWQARTPRLAPPPPAPFGPSLSGGGAPPLPYEQGSAPARPYGPGGAAPAPSGPPPAPSGPSPSYEPPSYEPPPAPSAPGGPPAFGHGSSAPSPEPAQQSERPKPPPGDDDGGGEWTRMFGGGDQPRRPG